MARPAWRFRCVSCRGVLHRERNSLVCRRCETAYPVVAGVPLLVREPHTYLRSSFAQLRAARERLEHRAAHLDVCWRQGELPTAGLERRHRVTAAALASLEAFERPFDSAEQHLGADDASAACDSASPGWAAEALLPYLLRDWQCNRELRAASDFVSAAIDRHLPRRVEASLVVAGCGAGGLLRHLAQGFSRAAGVDLSLPILVAIRELFSGGKLALKIPVASESGVRIADVHFGPASEVNGRAIEIVAADACRMPFPSRRIDCVVTPFLLDVIGDPQKLAREIHRILSPEGVWLSYGPSNSFNSIWYFDASESAAFLAAEGFTPVETTSHRTTHLDRREFDESASFEDHVCYLFVAHKSVTSVRRASARRRKRTPAIGDLVPAHNSGAALVRRRALGASDDETIVLEQVSVNGLWESFQITEAIAQALDLVDGRRTVREIAAKLKEVDPAIDQDDAIEAFGRFFDAGLIYPK